MDRSSLRETADPKTVASLKARQRVSGTDPSGGFAYRLDLSAPCLAAAVHAGHGVRGELAPLMVLSEAGRLAEEDAATDRIIGGCPSTIRGLDSRAEYDLNRPPELALPLTPEMFWGTRVFGSPPADEMNRRSLDKYDLFYRFVAAVVQALLERFGACIVYDVHSYNIRRQRDKGHPTPPVFNLGTRGIDRKRWQVPVEAWLEGLERIALPGRKTTVAENDVFGGEGEFCRRLTAWDANILVLPTEIAKVYMDEHTGVVHDRTTGALERQLAAAVAAHSSEFRRRFCR